MKVTKTKLNERYSLPEVDNAIYHFRNDLGREPEVDDIIDYMVRVGDIEEPDDPMKSMKWYSDWACEIAPRLNEDTVRNSDGTWSNKGDEGSHGKFKTKKKADAQRKAMFANGYRESLLNEAGRYGRFNPLKEVVLDALDFLCEKDYPFPQDRYLADSWYDWKEGIETGVDDYFEAAQILEDYLSDYAFNKEVAFLHDSLSDYIDMQLRADKNGGIWESLTEDVIPNKEINYIGFFVNTNDINRVLKSIGAKSLEKKIPVPHVTTEYKPKEIETSLFGKTIDIVINGYGKNDTNEGFRVELRTNDPDLQNQIDNIAAEGSIPHITTSISADGKAVNTRYLDFKDIKPITIKGTFGGFTKNKGIITSLKESLFLEKQGDSAKLDQRSKKYIADPTANAINSLLGLQKRQKKSFFGANGSNGSGGKGSWNEKTVVTIGDRNFELMCKKYGFLQKDFNIHNVLRREAKKGIKLGDLAWRIKNEGSTRKDVKWIEKAIMKWVAKNESLMETKLSGMGKKEQQVISIWEDIYERLKSSSKGMIDFEFTLPNSILKNPQFWSFSEDFCEELGFSFSIDERNYQGRNCTIHGYAELEDTLEENTIFKSLNTLTEAWFTPLSEMSSFTGWMDDDKVIDEEERFNSKVEKALKTKREDIQVLVDEDFQYDPRTYSIEEVTPVQEIKTKNIHANKFIVNGIEFIFEDAGSSSSPRLYFKSEEDGEAYTNYIDHFYDEEM